MSLQRLSVSTVVLLVAYLATFALLGTSSKTTIFAESDLSRSFNSFEKIEPGSLVSLDSTKEGYVTGANIANKDQLVGVAVVGSNSVLAVNNEPTKTQVAISGQTTAIVSDLNGAIAPGDMIAVTSFTGVGAKALPGDRVIGVAQASFTGGSDSTKNVTITDNDGNTKDLKLGTVPVVVSVGVLAKNGSLEGSNQGVLGFASSIAGRPVSVFRVALSMVIGLTAIISLVIVLSSTIKNGVSAVARNPLAKPAIFDTLAQVMVMIAFIGVVSVVLMYAALRV